MRHPGDLGIEALDVLGLLLEEERGTKSGKYVVVAGFLITIELVAHDPQSAKPWSDDHAAADRW
jgi:hypothetical protein